MTDGPWGAAQRRRARFLPLVLTLLVGLLGAACGSEEDGPPGSAQPQGGAQRITLGTQNFTEAMILGELYRQALAANGYNVNLRKNMGTLEVLDKALTEGEIQSYPAYMGAALSVVAKKDATGLDAEKSYSQTKAFYESRGQTLSEQTPYENVDAIATLRSFAQENRLRTLSDLSTLDRLTVGARAEFATRFQGMEGLEQVYKVTKAEFKPVKIGAQYSALDDGEIDAANVFTTDPQLADGDYTLLEDPERIFGSQHVALVIAEDELDRVGRDKFMGVVSEVNRRLTTEAIIGLNKAVELDGESEADVAARFLRTIGVLQGT